MKKEDKIKILIVDDHQILIDGLKALLKSETEFEIVGEATLCSKALEMLPDLNPDIIITDINMPEMSGIEFATIIHTDYPGIKILALSMYGEKGMISEMLDAGVSGYVLKNIGREELVNALKKIVVGEMYFSNEVAAEMMKNIARKKELSAENKKANLTPREKEIMKLIVKEFSNSKIAETLFISESTIETHRKNIYRKTNTKSIVGLVKYIIDNNLS